MKLLATILLTVGLYAVPQVGAAQDAGRNQRAPISSAEDFEVIFDNVVYSLKNIDNVLKDLDSVDHATGQAISKYIAQDVYARLKAGFDLMSAIMLDKTLSKDRQANLVMELSTSLGQILFTVIRHQGEDPLVIPKDPSPLYKAGTVFKEMLLDIKSFFPIPRQSARLDRREYVWGPMERINRDRLARQAVETVDTFAQEVVSKLEPASELERKTRLFWGDHVLDKMEDIRRNRVTAQRLVSAMYLGFSAWAFVAPMIDIVGVFDGRSENSLFVSSVIYATTWAVIGGLKFLSVPNKTLAALGHAKESFKKLGQFLAPKNSGTLIQRLSSINPFRPERGMRCEDLAI